MSSRVQLGLALAAALTVMGCLPQKHAHRLLAEGRAQEVLRLLRPTSATAYFLRARAFEQLGQVQRARTELLIGLSLDDGAAEGHRLLGAVEERLGCSGAALAHWERALAIEPQDAATRRAVARLLALRAHYRSEPTIGLLQLEEARGELRRAVALDSGLLARRRPAALCPGPPLALQAERPLSRGPCTWARADDLLEQTRRCSLLLACDGAALGLKLEAVGCLGAAARLWDMLAAETPSDPRWPLQQARSCIARGELNRAQLYLQDYVYKSARRRAAALLDVARLLAGSGHCGHAGSRAVEALAFTKELSQQLESIRILAGCGLHTAVRRAAELVLASPPRPELRALVEGMISEAARRRPQR